MAFITAFKINKITILTGRGQDRISFTLDAPTAHPEMGYEPEAVIETRAGYGRQWLQEAYGLVPHEIIDMKTGEVTKP